MKNKTRKNNPQMAPFVTWYKLGVFVAMQGMVNPSLRCIAIDWVSVNNNPKLYFFHDGINMSDLVWDNYSCIETETTCSVPDGYPGEFICTEMVMVPLPYPNPIPNIGEVIYLRKEPNSQFDQFSNYAPTDWAITAIIRLKINEALRGKVTPDLRQIQFRWIEPEKKCLITYIHNGPVTQKIQAHYQEMFDLATSFPWKHQQGLVTPQMEVLSIPYPQAIPQEHIDKSFYSRKEPFEDPV